MKIIEIIDKHGDIVTSNSIPDDVYYAKFVGNIILLNYKSHKYYIKVTETIKGSHNIVLTKKGDEINWSAINVKDR